MLFNTLDYAVFFAVAFVGAWGLARYLNGWLRIGLLLLLSYGFYAACDWRYLPLIFVSSTVDFLLARAIAREKRPGPSKALLAATVALNLGFLGFFKYSQFAADNARILWSYWSE